MAKRKIQMTSKHLQEVHGTHQPQPASRSVDSTAVPSPDQPFPTSSLGTDTQQRTTTSESTGPVMSLLLSPSAGDNVETCVTCLIGIELHVQ